MRLAATLVATTVLTLLVCDEVGAQQKTQKQPGGAAATQYWVDVATHSTVELCAACWNAYRQRQVFSAGCCG